MIPRASWLATRASGIVAQVFQSALRPPFPVAPQACRKRVGFLSSFVIRHFPMDFPFFPLDQKADFATFLHATMLKNAQQAVILVVVVAGDAVGAC
jgi:hypothetical protein